MEKVTRWKTSDGNEHETREEAKTHEAMLEAIAKLRELLRTSVRTGRVDSVLREMLVEVPQVTAILSTYRKRLPKPKTQMK